MKDLIERLRKAEGSPTLKSVLLGMFSAEQACMQAANALERMTWNTDITLSNEEQQAEAVRSIVTAQHEIESMAKDNLEYTTGSMLDAAARQENACEWLSLC